MRTLILLFLGLMPLIGAAQGTVRGKITDGQTGETLIGANAFVEGTTKGAMADLDGNYNLTISSIRVEGADATAFALSGPAMQNGFPATLAPTGAVRVDVSFTALKSLGLELDAPLLDLAWRLLRWQPDERISAEAALRHPALRAPSRELVPQ